MKTHKTPSLSEIASAAGLARYAAQCDGTYKGQRKLELDNAESAAWSAIAQANKDRQGPSERKQLGFSAL